MIPVVVAIELLFGSAVAFATQAHGGSEGILVHQLGHVFFMLSMGAFVYWTRDSRLFSHAGWRYIKYAAALLVLWNMDVILVHFLEEQAALISVERVSSLMIDIHSVGNSGFLEYFYYLARLDHLICVPALFFLYTGLKKLLATYKRPASAGDSQ